MNTQSDNAAHAVPLHRLVRPSWLRCIHLKDPKTFPIYITPWVSFQPLHQSALATTDAKTVVSVRLSVGWLRHQWTIAIGWSWTNDALCESAGRKKTHESGRDVAAPSDSQQQKAMPPSVGNAHNNTKNK